jgi:hypothetical protein
VQERDSALGLDGVQWPFLGCWLCEELGFLHSRRARVASEEEKREVGCVFFFGGGGAPSMAAAELE